LSPHLQADKQRKKVIDGALNLAGVAAVAGIILCLMLMISSRVEGIILFWATVSFLFGISWVRSRISLEEGIEEESKRNAILAKNAEEERERNAILAKNAEEESKRNAILAKNAEERTKRNYALTGAQKAWNSANDQWQKISIEQPFSSKFQELKKMHDEYNNLDVEKQRESNIYLLHSFLELQLIEPGKVQDLGVQRVATLAAWGIETAADVTYGRVQAVPGFGPTRTADLLAWRANLEAKFRSNPQRWNRASLAGLEQKYTQKRQDLERALSEGPSRLEQLKRQATQQQAAALTHLRQLAENLAQAKADMSVF
jgi:hypothetical protein